MIRISILFMLVLFIASPVMAAGEAIEGPKGCRMCGMDRSYMPESRMLVTYADGEVAGYCSFRCAVGEMKKQGDRPVTSIQVADYRTKALIDARSAIWVVGGKISGGMNAPAKWAFGSKEEADRFVQDNGGDMTTYERLAMLREEGSESPHHHHTHGAGGAMFFPPAFADDIYHVHPAGMWMANYKYMHMVMSGLRNGTTDVPTANATPVGNEPFGYMMAPTRMTMDMHMVMLMYGVTDKFSLMAMGTYLDNRMSMVMNMGAGNEPDSPMRSSGIGDTELRAIYSLSNDFTGSLGLSIPTGNIGEDFSTMGRKFRAPYGMQLGSGTVDLKPALTYNVLTDDQLWNWGSQAMYTWRTGYNSHGYKLGDSAKVTSWFQRALGPAAGWLRFAYTWTDRIHGEDPKIAELLEPDGAPTPDADPKNYGGHRIDGYVGASIGIGQFSLGVEAGMPLYQNLNGLQLKNQWYLTAGLQAMF